MARDAGERLPPLVDVRDEELGPRDILVDVAPLVLAQVRLAAGYLAVELLVRGVDVEEEALRLDHLYVVDVLAVCQHALVDDHVWQDRVRALAGGEVGAEVAARGERVEVALDELAHRMDGVGGGAERQGDLPILVLAELLQELVDDLVGKRLMRPLRLEEI